MTHDPEQQKGRKMFEEIIEFDQEKIEANNYDIDKINAYLDELHDVKEIRKKQRDIMWERLVQLNWQDLGQLLWLVRKVNGFGKLLKSGNFGKMVD